MASSVQNTNLNSWLWLAKMAFQYNTLIKLMVVIGKMAFQYNTPI